MKEDVCIYVVAHKQFKEIISDGYKKIAVGSLANEAHLNGYLKDNYGEHISDKNNQYCELTALYWIWKNTNANITGLCHYRRYFTKSLVSNQVKFILTQADIQKKLAMKSYDIILPYRPCARRTVSEIYCDFGYQKDLTILREVLQEKYPMYVAEFDALMKRHSNYSANMMICRKETLNQYCQWLFDILFEVEKRVDISEYSTQEKRIFGFMSERLLEVWVRYNKLKIKHYRLLKTDKVYHLREQCMEMLGIALNPFKY